MDLRTPELCRLGVKSRTIQAFRFFLQILHYQGDSPVRRVLRRIRLPQSLVREAVHLCYLVIANSISLHHSPCRIRPVRGQFPVSVRRSGGILLRIRVAIHRDVIRQFAELVRQHAGRKPGLAIQRPGSRLHKFQEGLGIAGWTIIRGWHLENMVPTSLSA